MKKRCFVSAVLFIFVFMFFGSAAHAFLGPIVGSQAKVWAATIEKLERERKFSEVVSQTTKFIDWLHKVEKLDPAIKDFLPRMFDTKANAQSMQGFYNSAANTIREKNISKPDSSNIEKVMNYEKKDLSQREFFNMANAFHNERIAAKKVILSLVREKEKIVKDFLKQKDVTKEGLEKLQKTIKEIEGRVQAKEKQLSEVVSKYYKDTEKFHKDQIVFTFLQNMGLNSLSKVASDMGKQIWEGQKEVREGLLKVSEKYQHSWNGLEEKLGKMKEVHGQVKDLQKKILALMEKKPLTDAAKKELMALKERLDKLHDEHANLMAGIEKAFMDAATFNKLTPDEQKKYMDIFTSLREGQKDIDSNNKKIMAFVKEMSFKFGDLNGDGKLDKVDLKMLEDFLKPRPWPFSVIRMPYNRAADLDGDGHLDWADLGLLRDAVFGDRKVFPVEKDNKPGDLNGNGRLDENDISFLAKIMTNPKGYAASFRRLADLNRDGKIDASDMVELVKRYQNQVKLILIPPIVRILATGTTEISTGTGNLGVVPASGTIVDDSRTGRVGTGTPATTLDSSY
ncbi:hypothetical protein HYY75_04035 [bacterium]|nr:hypothetical protein [bacterium]